MDRPKKLIYFEIVQNDENGYAYGGFESLRDAVSHLPEDNSAHIEMTTEIHEVVDLKKPCDTCKCGNNNTILRCIECKSPWWKNHEPRDLYENTKWIPVNERLPKEYVPVMISTPHSVFPEARYSKKYGWEWAAYAADGNWWLRINNIVTAWMPLPEPYKESEENKNER